MFLLVLVLRQISCHGTWCVGVVVVKNLVAKLSDVVYVLMTLHGKKKKKTTEEKKEKKKNKPLTFLRVQVINQAYT